MLNEDRTMCTRGSRCLFRPTCLPHAWCSPLQWLAEHPDVALRVGPVGPNELGFYVDELRLIVVHPDLTPDELFDTLAHEVVHAIRRDRGDGNGDCGDEDEVDRLAQEMFGPYRAPQPANA